MRRLSGTLAVILTLGAMGPAVTAEAADAHSHSQAQAPQPLLPPPPLVPAPKPREPLFPVPLPRLPLPTGQVPASYRSAAGGSSVVCGIRVMPVMPDVDPKSRVIVPRGDVRHTIREAPVPIPCPPR